jgi:ribosomal-protein-alanine N-acetyltransferase
MRLIDLDRVMDIERQSFRTPWSRQVFVEEMDREWAYVDVLRPRGAGTVLGFVNYWLVRDEVHILNVAAHTAHRRRGVATQLLAHVIGFARRRSCRYATLEVRRSNMAAIRLYEKFGFKPVGVRPHYYAEDNEDAIVMLLELD